MTATISTIYTLRLSVLPSCITVQMFRLLRRRSSGASTGPDTNQPNFITNRARDESPRLFVCLRIYLTHTPARQHLADVRKCVPFVCVFAFRDVHDIDGVLGLFARNAIGNFRYRHLSGMLVLLAESPHISRTFNLDPNYRMDPSMPTSFRQIINSAVKDKRLLVVPGAHDALSARLIQKIGFETYFIGGFPAVGARYGVPDVGLMGFGEISAAVRDIMSACDLPVFVDGDDGYGDVKNVVHTVQAYERMGVSAILIEDQQWPKRCGHMVGKKVVATELAEAKIRAACSERLNPETWILARTDARAVYDIDEAMRRAERYIRAGADGIFIEAPRSIDELKRIGRAFDVPQVCNPLMGGHTPILSMEELGELGFNCAVLGLDTLMHAAKAIEAVLIDMKSGKFARRNDGMDFEDYKRLVGYDKWESVDERFTPRQ